MYNAWKLADIKFFISANVHVLYIQRAFFYQIINFTEKLWI